MYSKKNRVVNDITVYKGNTRLLVKLRKVYHRQRDRETLCMCVSSSRVNMYVCIC